MMRNPVNLLKGHLNYFTILTVTMRTRYHQYLTTSPKRAIDQEKLNYLYHQYSKGDSHRFRNFCRSIVKNTKYFDILYAHEDAGIKQLKSVLIDEGVYEQTLSLYCKAVCVQYIVFCFFKTNSLKPDLRKAKEEIKKHFKSCCGTMDMISHSLYFTALSTLVDKHIEDTNTIKLVKEFMISKKLLIKSKTKQKKYLS